MINEINDNNQTCEICLENYDYNINDKIPKKLKCCGQTLCLKCLKDIYNRNNNKILCPICRRITYDKPEKLSTNKNVIEGYLNCLNCGKKVIKSELFLHLDSLKLRCKNCQNDDFPLNEYIPEIVGEITYFIKDYLNILNENNNFNDNKLIKFIENKIHKELQEFFKEIENLIVIDIRNKIINDINNKLKYNVNIDFKQFYNDIYTLKNNKDYLESFMKDDTNKKFSSQLIQDNLSFISLNMEKIRSEQNKFSTLMNLFKSNKLFTIKERININEIGNFFYNILDTMLSDYDNSDFFTGISYFDNMIQEGLINKNNIKKEDYEKMEKNYKFKIKNLEDQLIKLKIENDNNKNNNNNNDDDTVNDINNYKEHNKEKNDKYNNYSNKNNENNDKLYNNNNNFLINSDDNNNEFESFQKKKRNNLFDS